MWQCKWINLVDNFGTDASDITWYHDDQILNQLATNQNMHIWIWVWVSLTVRFADFTDVTLADEDTKSKLTDNAKRAIQDNESMQVM